MKTNDKPTDGSTRKGRAKAAAGDEADRRAAAAREAFAAVQAGYEELAGAIDEAGRTLRDLLAQARASTELDALTRAVQAARREADEVRRDLDAARQQADEI